MLGPRQYPFSQVVSLEGNPVVGNGQHRVSRWVQCPEGSEKGADHSREALLLACPLLSEKPCWLPEGTLWPGQSAHKSWKAAGHGDQRLGTGKRLRYSAGSWAGQEDSKSQLGSQSQVSGLGLRMGEVSNLVVTGIWIRKRNTGPVLLMNCMTLNKSLSLPESHFFSTVKPW